MKSPNRKASPLKLIKSLNELYNLAEIDKKYADLLRLASSNLGGPNDDLKRCNQWLRISAMETSEENVVEEVNNLI